MKLVDRPFPHVVLDGRWDDTLLDGVYGEFPLPGDARWIRYDNEHEGKYHGDVRCWGSATLALLEQFKELALELGDLFGIEDLVMETVGGGMHLIPPGGRLDIHTDFNRSPETKLYRRLNLMCYLNRSWGDPGGELELHVDKDDPAYITYVPEFNRTVVFESSDRSWHGHSVPSRRWRLSVAAYYFSEEPPPGYTKDHSTVWMHP